MPLQTSWLMCLSDMHQVEQYVPLWPLCRSSGIEPCFPYSAALVLVCRARGLHGRSSGTRGKAQLVSVAAGGALPLIMCALSFCSTMVQASCPIRACKSWLLPCKLSVRRMINYCRASFGGCIFEPHRAAFGGFCRLSDGFCMLCTASHATRHNRHADAGGSRSKPTSSHQDSYLQVGPSQAGSAAAYMC